MNVVILDTNGFLRLLLNDIPKQADQVEQLIEKAKKEQVKIIVPQIVLFEINFILERYYNLEKEEIIDKLKSLLSASYFAIESKEVFRNALVLYERHTVSFTDCFLLAFAKVENAELFTFDQQLLKLKEE